MRNRFHGNINGDIKKYKLWLENYGKFNHNHNHIDNFYLSWYKSYAVNYLKFLRVHKFIPNLYYRDQIYKKTFDELTSENEICLKDIKLPVPADKTGYYLYMSGIVESLWTYLSDNIGHETACSLFPDYMEGPYEYKDVKLNENDIVIDAGANIGEFSALASVRKCKSYAFEPMPHIIDSYLSKIAEKYPDITICQYALSDKQAVLDFTVHSTDISASSYVMNPYIAKNSNNTIKVQAIDLDTFVNENNLPRVDFIKADIEGAERFMLMGAKQVLKDFAPKLAICKYHLPDDPQILRELILDANPSYVIEERWKKIYAYVSK